MNALLRTALILATASSALAQTRLPTGAPGPDYWQQRADYSIAVTLDVAKHEIRGRTTIRYHNNSPVALPFIYLQLDQNLFRARSIDGFIFGDITQELNGQRVALAKPSDATKTIARLNLAEPLAPGTIATLHIDYSFLVPTSGRERMGRGEFPRGRVYALGQWYPRVAVYDDVVGWNTEPYLGVGEFFLEYGDFEYAVTVPRDYIVTGTGTLENAAEVLTEEQQRRLAQARTSDATVEIISHSDVASPVARPAGAEPTLTWRFRAQNVRDVAWATSRAFVWDAAGWNNVLVQSLYPSEAARVWHGSTQVVRKAISTYSEVWAPYPYATATNVATSSRFTAMEYPMIAFEPAALPPTEFERITLHEMAHQWFPMMVGSNERLHAWMDEGFATFIGGVGTSVAPVAYQTDASRRVLGRLSPITTAPDKLPPERLDAVFYYAPAAAFALLRQHILGPAAFDGAFREYIRRWAYKHPTPADFFNTMNDVTGQDLNWFWKGWFETTDPLDQAIDAVHVLTNSDGKPTAQIELSSPGRLRFPVKLRVSYSDGTRDEVLIPVGVWDDKSRGVFEHVLRGKVVAVEIDPDAVFPDVQRKNNVWRAR